MNLARHQTQHNNTMRNHIYRGAALAALALGAAAAAHAQASRSGYFLDNYTYGYRLNPAMASTRASWPCRPWATSTWA